MTSAIPIVPGKNLGPDEPVGRLHVPSCTPQEWYEVPRTEVREGMSPGQELWPQQQPRRTAGALSTKSARVSSCLRVLSPCVLMPVVAEAPGCFPRTLEAYPYQAPGPEWGQVVGQAPLCCPLAPLRPGIPDLQGSPRGTHSSCLPTSRKAGLCPRLPDSRAHTSQMTRQGTVGWHGGGGLVSIKQVLSSLC